MLPQSSSLIPLMSGAYQARGDIGNYQICENLFPEINPQETQSPVPMTHYPRGGLRPLSSPPTQGRGRGVFALSNGNLFGIVGPNVYYIDKNWVWNLLGQITDLATPVSMSDNGITGVLVDGTPNGYTINLGSNAFAKLVDTTGTFLGSRRTDFADTFLAFATPNTNGWSVTLSDQVIFNALVSADADSTPDPIQTLAYNIRQMWLLKTRNTEIWFLAGSTPFPYQSWPNVFVPYGCAAPYSVVRADIDLFWISANEQGQALAVMTTGYGVAAISTRALEYEWSTYPTISDVIGGTYQLGGHTFIKFHFPTADVTWNYDLATKQWHRGTYIDRNGVRHREKASFYASVGPDGGYPKTIVAQDWATGQIYAVDPEFYTDNGQPIVFRRSFPHVVKELHFLTGTSFVADFQTGGIEGVEEVITEGSPWSNSFSNSFGPLTTGAWQQTPGPTLCMRASRNGGASFSNFRQKTLISSGNYRSMQRWRGLGMGRDWVFELMWAYPGPSVLNGAYLEMIEHSS